MNLTIGQLTQLVRGALETEPGNLAINHALRNLAQFERNAEKYLTKSVSLPEKREDPFGKKSIPQSEPEDESPVETVKRPYSRRSYKKDEEV